MQIIHFIVQLLFLKKLEFSQIFSVCLAVSFFFSWLGLVCLVWGVLWLFNFFFLINKVSVVRYKT